MAELHVVNASVTEPVFAALGEAPTQSERLLERCGLNPDLQYSATGLLPLHAAEQFLAEVQRHVGTETFVYDTIGRHMTARDRAVANIPLGHCQVALDAVKVFVKGLDQVLTGTRFFWQIEGRRLWIRRTVATTQWSDEWTIVQYNLSVILNGMRALFGAGTRAVAADVATRTLPGTMPDALSHIPIRTSAPFTGLAFPARILSADLADLNPDQRGGGTAYQPLSMTEPGHVESCIAGMLGSENTGRLAVRAATAFGVSTRTYHRRLAQQGTSHSTLVSNARLRMAQERLSVPAMNVSEIALELGYRYPGDFTRFFRTRTGLTPTQYRKSAVPDLI